MAPMACSRMPKWMLRPSSRAGEKLPAPLISVRFDSARSAEPPTSDGTIGAARLMAAAESLRVASAPGPASSSRSWMRAGTQRVTWVSSSADSTGLALRQPSAFSVQARFCTCFSATTWPKKVRTSSGTRKRGSTGQPSASLVAFSSSSPSGAPWTPEVPAFFGEP